MFSLTEFHKSLLPPLAPLPGTVHAQRVRCGRENCRCARGELHRAFYRFWREGGRLRKAYVRRAEVERVRDACRRWREAKETVGAILKSASAAEVRREVRATLRAALGSQAATRAGRRQLRRFRE